MIHQPEMGASLEIVGVRGTGLGYALEAVAYLIE